MGREIRRVKPDWIHPEGVRLNDESYEEAMATYEQDKIDYDPAQHDGMPFEEWQGGVPDPELYRPHWTKGEATAYQVYENVSEGSPVSPVFKEKEELIAWLMSPAAEEGCGPLSRKAAEKFFEAGTAPSMMMTADRKMYRGAHVYEIM